MKRNTLRESLRQQRIENVNALVKVIGDCGRHFFKYEGRYASIEVDDRGRAWWIDQYTEKRIYMHYSGRWRGFSNGGTLRDLAKDLREYVVKGTRVPTHHFGPWPDWYCGGDPWGYGKDMETVREAARSLGVVSVLSAAA
ncbi:hypothetical protein [Pseudohongiella sp. O18]|uniref:hypothetical protein n=1 Tax=Pseudohongiella sp. O18 TaxID=2904248 RepID=UPI001F24C94C|nr:hypothetical protein [Pseudohongiella sp. O18]